MCALDRSNTDPNVGKRERIRTGIKDRRKLEKREKLKQVRGTVWPSLRGRVLELTGKLVKTVTNWGDSKQTEVKDVEWRDSGRQMPRYRRARLTEGSRIANKTT